VLNLTASDTILLTNEVKETLGRSAPPYFLLRQCSMLRFERILGCPFQWALSWQAAGIVDDPEMAVRMNPTAHAGLARWTMAAGES
jgi:hypothetical protein